MKKTFFVVWEINNTCNNDCVYCHIKKNYTGLSFNTIKKTAINLHNKYKNDYQLHIILTGGEPTLRIDIVTDLAKMLSSRDIVLGICTNGTNLDNVDICNALLQYYSKITISLDTPTSHNSLRFNENCSIEQIWENVRFLSRKRTSLKSKLIIGIAVTLSKINIHILEELLDKAKNTGVDRVEVRPLQCNPNDTEKNRHALTLEDVAYINKLDALRRKYEHLIYLDFPQIYHQRVVDYISGKPIAINNCLAGKEMIFIDSYLNVLPCCSYFPRNHSIPFPEFILNDPIYFYKMVQKFKSGMVSNNCDKCLDIGNVHLASEMLNIKGGKQ